MRARRALLLPTAAAALLLSGCTGSSNGDDGPTPSSSASTSSSTSPSASPSPTVTGFTSTCGTALSLTDVGTAAGQPIIGRTEFIVGEADASIGRLAYLNCRYGLPETAPAAGAPAAPGVEIGISLYESTTQATARVAGTVEDYRSSGSTPSAVPVGQASGTLLIGRGQPATLVVASAERTVAVSVIGKLYTGPDQMAAIADLALTAVT